MILVRCRTVAKVDSIGFVVRLPDLWDGVRTGHGHGRHVRRYLGNATPSVLDPQETPTWQTRLSTRMAKTFLRQAYDEIVGMSEIVMTSGLDWTIVRFLAPKDGPAKGTIRQGFYGRTSWASTLAA